MDTEKSISEHINEARKYIIYLIIIYLLMSVVMLSVSTWGIEYILNYYNAQAVILSPLEYVNMQIKFAIGTSLILIMPILIYVLWKYISPVLNSSIKRDIIYLSIKICVLGILGILFGFYIFTYLSLNYLKIIPENIIMLWSLQSIINYALITSIIFGLIFQIIIIIPFMCKIGIIKKDTFKKNRKYVLLIIVVIASWITPTTDAITMLFMAIPTYGCFELGVLFSRNEGEIIWQ